MASAGARSPAAGTAAAAACSVAGTAASLVFTVTMSKDAAAPRANRPKRPSTATALNAWETAIWSFSVTLTVEPTIFTPSL